MKSSIYTFLLILLCSGTSGFYAQILTVDHPGDSSDSSAGDGFCDDGSGYCTLRAAIEEANANATITTIEFDSARVITPATALPNITRANLTINGTSASGASCGTLVTGTTHTLQIVIDGSGQASGDLISVGADGITLQGLVLQNSPSDGVYTNASNIIIQCCYIGTDQTGSSAAANSAHGINVSSFDKNIAIRNSLVSGNVKNGIYINILGSISASGNLIGTNAAGDAALPNDDGIEGFGAVDCIIGGSSATDRNIISGNADDGFDGGGTGSYANEFYGNYIGTDITGTVDLGNGGIGIRMHNGNKNFTIGGAGAGEGNVISGNGSNGIRLMRESTVLGNYIGTDYSGTNAIGNGDSGIYLRIATDDCTLGNTSGGGNVIAFNGAAGISYANASGANGTGNIIQGNSIFNNTGLGIDLNNDGSTANDTDDADIGANNLQNCPDFMGAQPSGSDMEVEFSVGSTTTNSTYPLTIDIYKADNDSEEGQTWIGSVSYTAAEATSSVTKTFTPTVSTTTGEPLVVTATDANGNTSEFSDPVSYALPVEMTRFTVKESNKKALLQWTTASETNNDGFAIEHQQGDQWRKIGFVRGAGNSFTEINYSFETEKLSEGKHHFRLRQMDFGGEYTYSQVLTIEIEGQALALNFYPNPIKDRATLHVNSELEGELLVQIFDANGQLVKQHDFEKTTGTATFEMDLRNLPSGTYILRLDDGLDGQVRRFVRQ